MANWRNEYVRYKKYFLNIYQAYQKKRDIMMFLEILLSLTTIAILAVFALRPTAITIIGLVKEIKAKEELVEQMDTKISNLSTAQSLYSREARRISLLNQSIPDTPQFDSFYEQLIASYAQNGLQVSSVSSDEVYLVGDPGNSTDEESFESVYPIPITSQSLGGYSSVKNLVSQLENLRRPMFIDQLTISPDNIEDPNIILFNVNANTYYYNEVDTEASQSSGLDSGELEGL